MIAHRKIGLSLLVVALAGIAASASAEGLTRAQVRQQLIEAENNGLRYITDTSYPEVSPVFAQQAAHAKQQVADDVGGAAASHDASASPRGSDPSCVGPVSFCSIYSGS
jgi:type IV secretory pathway TrbL component